MTANHHMRCKCGVFGAEISRPERGTRAVCYCRDCQAFAHFLGLPPGMLDDIGGTDIVAVRPRDVRFTRGAERLACMSLLPNGTLRWYASCCRTAIGNTPRDYRQSHIGLIHCSLEMDGQNLADSFGPVKMRVNVEGATGKPESNAPINFALAVLRYLGSLTWSRISGKYRINPFLSGPDGKPRVEPQVLNSSDRDKLYRAVDAPMAPIA